MMSQALPIRAILPTATAALFVVASSLAVPPTPDHIVIVIEENHSFDQIIGSSQAPYINALAKKGLLFTNFFGITHPSQPNYLHQFSGSNQGVTSNSVPLDIPFSTANLGAAVIAAGHTFAGYSEDLPAVGSNVASNGYYQRKHNPWVNWQADPPRLNQLPSTVNRPFFATPPTGQPFFGDCNAPSDYNTLPALTFVVPNQLNDMHDGTIAQADEWLQTWIGPYADWALTHNSLLIITWDEDNSAARNIIPTIFYGPMVRNGIQTVTLTHHNLLRTLEDMYGATHAGSSANVRSIVGAFSSDVAITTRRFQQGADGYTDAHDTYLESANPIVVNAAVTPIVVDGSRLSQGLIRFDNIFGHGPNQIPPGASVLSAKLIILTTNNSGDSSANSVVAHRMIANWSSASTWNSMVSGISANDIEAATTPDFALIPNILDAWAIFDVSNTLQYWADAPDPSSVNRGWAILPTGTDGWRCASSEFSVPGDRPILEVTFRTPCPADIDHNWTVNVSDLLSIINAWGRCSPPPINCLADTNHDGFVNVSDLLAVINGWGPCP